ncbi:restriction endonuclease subunit S [Cyclobacterium jeungdonense]|uniref:Restriction endonuclease subunit S n=1 Tax=Cyclobacterium jeungdonense TaxID=708087 RepID=A0ABT8CB96_9BACT|nr:restriction endonuclease subunit S [Cyclobacterium jeungdonense]MDN3689657.1 restriction endonuclease subunit S [Cyclobacterium jeungdonense]
MIQQPTITKNGFKHTKAGLIPEDWDVTTLGDAVKFLDGKRKPLKEVERAKMHGNYPYYGASGIIDYVNDYIFDDELILLGEDGANIVNRSTPLAFRVSGKIWVNNHAHVLKPRESFELGYLVEYLESIKYDKYNTGTAQPKLNKDICTRIPIPKPPLPEQQKIAEFLSCWGQAISTTQKLIDELKLRNKGLAQQLLTGKRRLKGYEGKWEEQHLEHYFKERKETNHSELPLLSVGEIGVYPQTDSNKKDTSNEDKSKYKRICPGDIGYNTMRMWQGRSALSSLEGIVSPAYTIVTPKKNADAQFFAYLFKLDEVIHKFFRKSQGLVSDTLNCKFKDFKIVRVLTPPSIGEQKAIVSVLNEADKEVRRYQQQLDTLKEQKKGLIQKLLTGEIRVSV